MDYLFRADARQPAPEFRAALRILATPRRLPTIFPGDPERTRASAAAWLAARERGQ